MAEFRIFVPQLIGSDVEWLGPEAFEEYRQLYDIVAATIDGPQDVGGGGADRTDVYVIGKPYYGLKFRNEEKLEIKVRVWGGTTDEYCIESWEKSKIKQIGSKRAQEIAAAITSGGGSVDAGEMAYFETLADPANLISVEKQIDKSLSGSCVLEKDLLRPTTNLGAQRKWISVCVESSKEGIVRSLQTLSGEWRAVWISLLQMAEIVSRNLPFAAQHCCLLVFGGYPSWIYAIGGRASIDEIRAFSDNAAIVLRKILN
jgi:hypothetical protein